LYDKLGDTGSGGAAPRHDLTGFWAGQVAAKLNEVAPLTPWGQEQFRLHKNNGEFPVSESNDPIKGATRWVPTQHAFMTRGIAFAEMPAGCSSYFSSTGCGAKSGQTDDSFPKMWAGTPRTRRIRGGNGYSVGHWEGDYTFVVDTVGSDERSWLDNAGHPHSIDLRVQERYTRVNHNTLEVAITINDPKAYTKPFVITKSSFKWIPRQDYEEQLCVPSEEAEYLKLIGDPAAHATPGK